VEGLIGLMFFDISLHGTKSTKPNEYNISINRIQRVDIIVVEKSEERKKHRADIAMNHSFLPH
jgi:hypothetical protein